MVVGLVKRWLNGPDKLASKRARMFVNSLIKRASLRPSLQNVRKTTKDLSVGLRQHRGSDRLLHWLGHIEIGQRGKLVPVLKKQKFIEPYAGSPGSGLLS